MAKGTKTIVRVRRGRVDSLDDPVTTPGSRLEIRRVIILPRVSKEEGRGWVTHEGRDIYILPSSTAAAAVVGAVTRAYTDGDIVEGDTIEFEGKSWEVEGPPAAYDKGDLRKATLIRVDRTGRSE